MAIEYDPTITHALRAHTFQLTPPPSWTDEDWARLYELTDAAEAIFGPICMAFTCGEGDRIDAIIFRGGRVKGWRIKHLDGHQTIDACFQLIRAELELARGTRQ